MVRLHELFPAYGDHADRQRRHPLHKLARHQSAGRQGRGIEHADHGRRGVSNLYWGWTYCGCGNYATGEVGEGDNVLSTQQGLCPGLPDGTDNWHFWSYHANGANFVLADGSIHFLSYSINFNTFQALHPRRRRGHWQCLVGGSLQHRVKPRLLEVVVGRQCVG